MKVFIEEQKMNQPLVIIGLSIGFIVVVGSLYKELEQLKSANSGEQIGAFSGIIVLSLVIFLFVLLKLKTRIDEKGIYYKYFPFHLKYQFIAWNNISKISIRNYDAISEFGGWGIKFSFRKKRGKSFTTKGDVGLQLELKNGKKILIGTQKKEEIQRTIDTYKDKVAVNEY
ncbi:hypothetical protein [Lutibacter sp.]|uniref:hypothetical protein n=1 Tax=Lutibacter sp. TaxID=1925666 RepID=UPI002736DF7B|nr:hypothetical protein [Lutibacter sp.]MDP3312222.1 hypothetical protein [Lutibacter sp.]